MAAAIAHRGPDSDGFFESERVAFGFRRLAILDLSAAGNQPMSTDDAELTIVFNGEIYNFVELRSELEALGHRFRSKSDTEVLLHSYRQWGPDCVARLNGMWSFLIYDRTKRLLVGSRDRFGIKPLFSARTEQGWLFASEIKALHGSGYIAAVPNWPTIADFLAYDRLDESEATFYSGVRSVPAATWFELAADGDYRERRFWNPPSPEETTVTPDAPAQFAALFDDAIRLHRRSDVPLAVHLSGGLDSTSILCALGRNRSGAGEPLTALSFMSEAFDERRYIADTIGATGTDLRPLARSPKQLWDLLGSALAAHDEPFHSMVPLVNYALMQETRSQGIKVVLNGQGADETLAGYPSYFAGLWHELLRSGRIAQAIGQMVRFANANGRRSAQVIGTQLAFTMRALLGSNNWYRQLAARFATTPGRRWATPELAQMAPRRTPESWDVGLKDQLVRSIQGAPLPLYLRVEDRSSMANSVESRVPFLDYRLVEFALRLPSTELMDGGWNKWLLRRAMQGRIPESVRLRPDKMGFPLPLAQWLRGPLWSDVQDLLLHGVARHRELFDAAVVDQDLAAFGRGDDAPAMKMFTAAQFVVWWERVLKGRSALPVRQWDAQAILSAR